ncbi:MAG: heavy-metal-associated domain-containing protein [Turicibacter sp.]|jgi:copper chaperone|nr:heavy-metal-associated domain-containing protein [Turicibacter sp.]MBQ1786850.1 heavy-metal-associated domain-containing protein [Turicibacter sp.]MEE0881481.1 copper ion binding protein [Turicibacter sp.]
MELVLLKVNGMSCQHCVNAVNDAVTKLVGVKQVKVDLKEKLVEVEYNEEITNKLLIVECIEEQGFEVEL